MDGSRVGPSFPTLETIFNLEHPGVCLFLSPRLMVTCVLFLSFFPESLATKMALSIESLILRLTFLSCFFASVRSATVTYDFDVGWLTANPDGAYERTTIGINGEWPVPRITANVGDQVVVNVHNSLGNQSTSLHFHGLFQ